MVDKITNILKTRSLSVPRLLIQNYRDMKISELDLVVLIYLINTDDLIYNPKLISGSLNMPIEELMVSIDNLCTKGLIEIVIKDKEVKEEFISIDKLYEKLSYYVVNEDTEVKTNLFDVFESEFGRTLSSMEFQIINGWQEGNYTEDLIKAALKEATYNGVSNLRYIDKILYEWNKKGIKNIEDINKNRESCNSGESAACELFEFDWLNEK